ncbi:hypothetical protein PRtIB026_A46300 [Pseudomonas sp. RtIB026]|uniref:hypothetical protein n=1 Tax=Pseudomonas sp. RtIB026 TaxID=2749999 RepID=UPI00194522FC|nr:hypothetical protein [Pseudomonas sp. RtIB026]BCJ05571.1 hypothetical protein PRtIB026_A46300 [Pseudomonas sp. RtIB026]
MDLSPRRRWPTQLLTWLIVAIMVALNIQELPSFERPRRVFTRGFVMFCVLVVIMELMFLNQFFGHPR